VTSGNPNGGLTTAAAQQAASPTVFAHRGFAGIYPENTVAAVERAVADGRAAAIEVDVMPTADGELVVFHDDTLARVTNAPKSVATKPVWELSYEQIAGYSVLGTTQSVPLLSDVLAVIPADVTVNIELKNPGCRQLRFAEVLDDRTLEAATDRWLAFVGSVLDTATASGHELLVSSFYEGALAATRRLDSSVPIASVFYDSVETGLTLSRRYDVRAIHPPWNMLVSPGDSTDDVPVSGPFDNTDLVEIAAAEGWDINAWTVTTWHQAAALSRVGVDGIITDYPGVCTSPGQYSEPQPSTQ